MKPTTTSLDPGLGDALEGPVLAALLEQGRVGVAVHDRELRVVFMNQGLAEYLGGEPSDHAGRLLGASDPLLAVRVEPALRAVLATGQPVLGLEVSAEGGQRSSDYLPLRDAAGAVVGALTLVHDVADPRRVRREERDEARLVTRLAEIGRALLSELDLEKVVQRLTDEGVALCGAEYGAFFYNAVDDRGEAFVLYALSGASREAFAGLGLPRSTALFAPTFRGEGVVRLDDVTQDPRYARNPPFGGVPEGHPPVRSYLAVPVRTRAGSVLGGLFFAHSAPGVFTARAERVVETVAVYAGIAVENARLLADMQAALGRVARREGELRAITDALPALVAFVSVDERYQWVNRAYEDWFGIAAEDMPGRRLEDVLGAPAVQALRPRLDAVLRGEPVEFEGQVPYGGGARWVQARYVPQRGTEGEVVGFISLVLDVSAQRTAEAERAQLLERERAARAEAEAARARSAFLATASIMLASPLELERTLADVARLAVPVLARRCAIDLAEADGSRRRVAVAGTELDRGESIVVPIRAGGRVYGALTLDVERRGGPAEQAVAEDLAGRIGLALENVRLFTSLRQADQAKEEFLAMLGHELRNPLAPILTAMQLLRVKGPGAADRVQQVVERQAAHLTRLVDDILDVSRIGRGKIQLRRQRLDLAALVRDAASDHAAGVERAGLSLAVEVPADPVLVEADATRLAQVLGNLLGNAIKFTDRGGRVAVSLSRAGDRAHVVVRDTGIGMSREVLGRVFEPFTQADRTLDRSRGGLGLGLTVVRGIVELHGGAVRARSDGPGAGAEFTVELPLDAGAGPADLPAAATQRVAPPGLRVLVVEDNADAASTLRDLLESCGHRAEVAPDGAVALELAARFRPDVVLCDIGLPGLDGYAVGRALRALPETRAARLVALTGYGQDEDRRRALEAGFDLHLTKPMSLARLEEALARR